MVSFHDITDIQDPALAAIFALYTASFPKEEQRPWPSILSMIETHHPFFTLTAVYHDDAFAGFAGWWKLPGAFYIEHLAVEPSMRSKGVGAEILTHVASNAGNKPVVVEVELPQSGPDAPRRIAFYERQGFNVIDDVTYFQPPYAPGLPDVELLLMSNHPLPDVKVFVIQLHTIVYNQ